MNSIIYFFISIQTLHITPLNFSHMSNTPLVAARVNHCMPANRRTKLPRRQPARSIDRRRLALIRPQPAQPHRTETQSFNAYVLLFSVLLRFTIHVRQYDNIHDPCISMQSRVPIRRAVQVRLRTMELAVCPCTPIHRYYRQYL